MGQAKEDAWQRQTEIFQPAAAKTRKNFEMVLHSYKKLGDHRHAHG